MFATIYLDPDLLVLNKPSGLLAVPGRGADLQDCLSARVQAEFPEALIVHRLDRDTSGLMLMARSLDVQRALSRQFAEREVEKSYVAVVHGRVADDAGVIRLPMRKDFDRPPRHKIDPVLGRPAETHYTVVARDADCTRLALRPITGRSHQLRLHLAAIGHAILGDPLYADEAALHRAERLLLHAESLELAHPVSGARMQWTVPCPF